MGNVCACLPTRRDCRTDPRSFWEGRKGLTRGRYTNVRLNEAEITLNSRTDILYPLDGTFLVGNNRAGSESMAWLAGQEPLGGPEHSRLNVLVDHFGLTLVGGIFFGLEISTVSRRHGSGGAAVPLSRHR